MMEYSFKAQGHENILSNHKTTLEFTKDKELSKKGGCILGVSADFSLDEIKKLIKKSINKEIKIIIDDEQEINGEINPDFNSDHEIVIRKTDFISDRTLAINADKAAVDLSRELVDSLKKDNSFSVKLIFN